MFVISLITVLTASEVPRLSLKPYIFLSSRCRVLASNLFLAILSIDFPRVSVRLIGRGLLLPGFGMGQTFANFHLFGSFFLFQTLLKTLPISSLQL